MTAGDYQPQDDGQERGESSDDSDRMPSLEHQPLWIKLAALTVAIGGIIALIILYIVRL
jgi:hypothetical protein